jgi:hypothetical protein
MPAATAKTPSPNPFKKAHARMIREARGRWRGWAAAIADGGDWPSPRDILESGVILGLAEPAAALEADADALRTLAQVEKNIVAIEAAGVEALAPWGGLAGLEAAIVQAKAEATRLEELQRSWADGGPSLSQRWERDRIKRSYPRLFTEGNS